MFKRITLTALLALTPALAYGVDVDTVTNKVKSGITAAVNELQSKLPAIEDLANQIKAGNYSAITSTVKGYLQASNQPLIPAQAFQFVSNNIGSVQSALEDVLNVTIPPDVISALNDAPNGLGTQLQNLQSEAAAKLKQLDLTTLFNAFATKAKTLSRGEAEQAALNFVDKLKTGYQNAKINADQLITSAKNLKNTLGSLQTAAQNLEKGGILSTLDKLSTDLPTFITDKSSRARLSDIILGLGYDLNDQAATAKPFIDAFSKFINNLLPFVRNLFTTLGPVIWEQLPAQEQAIATEAFNTLKSQEATIINVVNTVKNKLNALLNQ